MKSTLLISVQLAKRWLTLFLLVACDMAFKITFNKHLALNWFLFPLVIFRTKDVGKLEVKLEDTVSNVSCDRIDFLSW